MESTLCPVCGYRLDQPAWQDGSASDEICPCCGIQFGYDDCCGGDPGQRAACHEAWRRGWVRGGMAWHSRGSGPPDDWDPTVQLRKLDQA